MKVFIGIDLGSTTTKALMLDEQGSPVGRGITNSRSNYDLAANIAKDEAFIGTRFTLLGREMAAESDLATANQAAFGKALEASFRQRQHLVQLETLARHGLSHARAPEFRPVAAALEKRLTDIFDRMLAKAQLIAPTDKSHFFRDQASSDFSQMANEDPDSEVTFDHLMGVFDKAILKVENDPGDLSFEAHISDALTECLTDVPEAHRAAFRAAVSRAAATNLEVVETIGTGYGRQRLPFPKESVRSEILCHGLGAHTMFENTATVLDIGGQDTKAIQVDEQGIVTSFQMNDRCAAGCGRYLGYIADEMSMGVHELGPLAMTAKRNVKISSTCTVFAGAELRDRLTMGQAREDILAGLHRAVILRAMSLLARSGGIFDEFTFTGGVANNVAAVNALQKLVNENYGERTINISPESIYTGALGAAIFGRRAAEGAEV